MGFSIYNIMSLANADTFPSFPIQVPFISYSYLIALARTSSIMLNRCHERGHPLLVPDGRGNCLHFSPLSMMLGVGLSHMALIYV